VHFFGLAGFVIHHTTVELEGAAAIQHADEIEIEDGFHIDGAIAFPII